MLLKRLSKAFRSKDRPRIPAGERIYAVGDLHGRSDLLDALVQMIEADDLARGPARTSLIFLGDLVDRGPDSKGVLDRLIALAQGQRTIRVLAGNHDEVFLKALNGDAKALRFLTRIGGRETILSYGVSIAEYDAADFQALAALLAGRVPAAHRVLLESLEDWVEVGDYLFVHAGIRPGTPIADQQRSDLRWIRDEFLSCRTAHPKLVVHGHSISAEPEKRPNRIGIDTGAFGSGRLTALGLEGEDSWFLTAQGAPDTRWGVLSD